MQNIFGPESQPYLLLVIGAVFVHMCYQVSVSVLTLLSSHTIGRGHTFGRLFWLGLFYTFGVIIASTTILLIITALLSWLWEPTRHTLSLIVMALLPVVGLMTMLYYYREGKGTKLWLPRPFVSYLTERAKKTRSGVEALMLGIATVIGEIPFVIAPLAIIALLIQPLSTHAWLAGSMLYGIVVSLPLVFILFYLTSGHSLARIQKWREDNKTFLQLTSGAALILLTGYMLTLQLGWGV